MMQGPCDRRRLDEFGDAGDDRLELPLVLHRADLTEQHVPQRLDIEHDGQRHRVLLGLLRTASVPLRFFIAAPHGHAGPPIPRRRGSAADGGT